MCTVCYLQSQYKFNKKIYENKNIYCCVSLKPGTVCSVLTLFLLIFPLYKKILILYLCFCYFKACISTDNVKTGDQQEGGQYQKCVPTPNVDARAKLEDSHFHACVSTDNENTGDQQEDGRYQKCVPTPSVDAGAKLEDSHFQACISTDNVKRGDQQQDGRYQKCVPTPSVDPRAKLEDHHFHACFSTPNVDTPAKQEDKPGDCKLEVNKSVIN